ncbi:hypothetical protein ACQKWADRAFT_288019 [Trichoderma austrokoningii]
MCMTLTLENLLSTVNLGKLFLEQLVTLLADIDNLCAGHAEFRHSGQNLFGDLGSGLVLGESIRVVEGVVYATLSVSDSHADRDGAWGLWSCATALMMAYEAGERACYSAWRGTQIEGGELHCKAQHTQIQCAQWVSEYYIPTSFVSDMVGELMELESDSWGVFGWCRCQSKLETGLRRRKIAAKELASESCGVCKIGTCRWGLLEGFIRLLTGPLRGFACGQPALAVLWIQLSRRKYEGPGRMLGLSGRYFAVEWVRFCFDFGF